MVEESIIPTGMQTLRISRRRLRVKKILLFTVPNGIFNCSAISSYL